MVKDEALRIISLFEVLPCLVVFDLDYTLWPFYCEMRSKREMPSLYPQAKGIIHAFQEKGIEMAIASRSPTPDIANTFIDKLGMKSMFVAKEIFSSWTHKAEHFQRIHRRTGVPFDSMLFFDDEYRNIDTLFILLIYVGDAILQYWTWYLGYGECIHEPEKDPSKVSKMGVTSVLVDNGVNLQELYSGLEKFSKNSKLADMNKTDL